jgi:hypothetical protein
LQSTQLFHLLAVCLRYVDIVRAAGRGSGPPKTSLGRLPHLITSDVEQGWSDLPAMRVAGGSAPNLAQAPASRHHSRHLRRSANSVSGSQARASMMISQPLRGTSRPTLSSRYRQLRFGTDGEALLVRDGVKCSRSTPQGITETLLLGTPSRASSRISSVAVTTMRSPWPRPTWRRERPLPWPRRAASRKRCPEQDSSTRTFGQPVLM